MVRAAAAADVSAASDPTTPPSPRPPRPPRQPPTRRPERRTFRVARVISVTPTGEPVARPPDFDLATAWHEVTDRMAERMRGSVVEGRADPTAEPLLRRLLDGRLRLGPAGPDGWLEMTVEGPSVQVVAAQLAGLGSRVEILNPPEARRRLAELAAELTSVYGTLEPDAHPAGTPPAR
ncbi:helix-turn-helix transcriptional regulator [Streptomyces profundus]|uniref:helix-turn-helix transcriptional regulator n=1 Tax=Streptomyces profundus TaxID=2867410 RepID=UPI001D16A905|nr:WYL domain-containing protein [Streptomyces sp. MA3_2.13]UED82777.1 WYL domain-containing protein [Streptomyces sp. MA3_2.13]